MGHVIAICQLQECFRQSLATFDEFQSHLVAATFPFNSYLFRHPINCRMKEKEDFNESLYEVHPRIAAADMGKLMCEDGFNLVERHSREETRWNQDAG